MCNYHRAYDLTLAQDLLGDWVAAVHKERCGQVASASRTHVVDSLAACQCLVRRLRRRRLSALQRIRCAYPVGYGTAVRESVLNDWLTPGWPVCETERGSIND